MITAPIPTPEALVSNTYCEEKFGNASTGADVIVDLSVLKAWFAFSDQLKPSFVRRSVRGVAIYQDIIEKYDYKFS
jgi:hypothetical protein